MNPQKENIEGARPKNVVGSKGTLLSNVPPPTELPQLVALTSPATSINTTQSPTIASNSPTSPVGDFLPTKFNPVIPADKGAPTAATQNPLDEETFSNPSTPASVESNQRSLHSAHEAEEDFLGDPMPGSGIFTWMKGAVSSGGLLHRVAEKAISSVDTMITTLDPQMKEFIYSGGDIEILVASDKEDKVSPVREAFQDVFGKATVLGFPSQSNNVASQPVGFAAALASAKDRITQLRSTNPKIGNSIPVVAVENFIIEVSDDKWFDLGAIVLTDPINSINLETFTQMTPVPSTVVAAAKGDTPQDYQFKDSGYSTTIGSYMAANLQVSHTQWHEETVGVSRRDIILLAAKSLATTYKKSLSKLKK